MLVQQIKKIFKKENIYFFILGGLIIWLSALSIKEEISYRTLDRRDKQTVKFLNFIVCERIKFLETESKAFADNGKEPVDCGVLPIVDN